MKNWIQKGLLTMGIFLLSQGLLMGLYMGPGLTYDEETIKHMKSYEDKREAVVIVGENLIREEKQLQDAQALFKEISKDLDLSATDANGDTFLIYILSSHEQHESPSQEPTQRTSFNANKGFSSQLVPNILALIFERYSKPDAQKIIDKQNINGDTALIMAVESADSVAVDALVKAGANPTLTNKFHDTALMLAEKKYNELKKNEEYNRMMGGSIMDNLPKIIDILKKAEAEWKTKTPEHTAEHTNVAMK